MNNRSGNSNHGYSVAAHLAVVLAATIGISALLAAPALAQNETILYSFAGTPDGWDPGYNLFQDAAGNLYGVTPYGGVYNGGTAYELSFQDGVWVETILHSFGGTGDGWRPYGGLVMDKAGNLYGTTSGTSGTVYELTPDGQGNWTETILKIFYDGGVNVPTGSLMLDAAGRLYGAAAVCGDSPCYGVVFRLTPPTKKGKPWKYFALYKFRGPKHKDGEIPNGNLVFDAAGDLYGTTWQGGTYNFGTVFELSPTPRTWMERILYSFQGHSDGLQPNAGLVFDAAGNLYGTTATGGSYGGGTVYELWPSGESWTKTVLYSFTGLSDGGIPAAGVTLRNGSLFGTTEYGGGSPNCKYGCGVVFGLSPSGGVWTEQVLHAFTSVPDGATPYGGVIFDSVGNLYGDTSFGGMLNSNCDYVGEPGCGIVYEISP